MRRCPRNGRSQGQRLCVSDVPTRRVLNTLKNRSIPKHRISSFCSSVSSGQDRLPVQTASPPEERRRKPERERAPRRKYGPPKPPDQAEDVASSWPEKVAQQAMRRMEMALQATGTPGAGNASEGVDDESKGKTEEGSAPVDTEQFQRKSAVLLDLAGATPDTLEGLLEKHGDELDEDLLRTLHRRIEVAKKYDEGPEVVEGLTLLFRRVRTEVERRAASPALRLLDDLFLIMEAGGVAGEREAATLETAAGRMDGAFAITRGGGVDIFAVAHALGGGEAGSVAGPMPSEGPLEEAAVEYVSHLDFVKEVEALVEKAQLRADQLEMGIEEQADVLRRGVEGQVYSPGEHQRFSGQLEGDRRALSDMQTTLRWSKKFIEIARMYTMNL